MPPEEFKKKKERNERVHIFLVLKKIQMFSKNIWTWLKKQSKLSLFSWKWAYLHLYLSTLGKVQSPFYQSDTVYGLFPRRKGNPSALLVGMQTGAATVENSMEFPQKTKNGTAVWPSNSTARIIT